jgi:hypothetical protein
MAASSRSSSEPSVQPASASARAMQGIRDGWWRGIVGGGHPLAGGEGVALGFELPDGRDPLAIDVAHGTPPNQFAGGLAETSAKEKRWESASKQVGEE